MQMHTSGHKHRYIDYRNVLKVIGLSTHTRLIQTCTQNMARNKYIDRQRLTPLTYKLNIRPLNFGVYDLNSI